MQSSQMSRTRLIVDELEHLRRNSQVHRESKLETSPQPQQASQKELEKQLVEKTLSRTSSLASIVSDRKGQTEKDGQFYVPEPTSVPLDQETRVGWQPLTTAVRFAPQVQESDINLDPVPMRIGQSAPPVVKDIPRLEQVPKQYSRPPAMPDVMNTNVQYGTTSSSAYEQPNFTVAPPGPCPVYSTGELPHSNPPEISINYEPWTSHPNTGNPWGLPQRMPIPSSQQQPFHYPGVSQVRLPSEYTIPQNEQQPTSKHSGIRKPATYNGSSSWKDHLVQFNLVADLNKWSEDTKALEFAASLHGTAQSILSDLSPDNRKSFHHLVEALTIRFEPKNQNEIYRSQLKSRLRKKGEDLATLAQDITKLVRKAYPSVPAETKDKFALDSFIDSLNDSDMEWAIYQGHPKTLQQASILAHEYEAFRTGRSRRNVPSGKIRSQSIQSDMSKSLNSAPNTRKYPSNEDLQVSKIIKELENRGLISPHTPTRRNRPKGTNYRLNTPRKTHSSVNPGKTLPGKCHYCEREGHWIDDCQ